MKKLGLVLLAGCLALAGCTPAPAPKTSKPPAAVGDAGYQNALATAKKENKRVFIEFSATWCGPCEQFKETLEDPRVVEALRDYVVLLVDTDRDPQLARKFSAPPIPKYCVVDADGKVLKTGLGSRGVAAFLAWLKHDGPGD